MALDKVAIRKTWEISRICYAAVAAAVSAKWHNRIRCCCFYYFTTEYAVHRHTNTYCDPVTANIENRLNAEPAPFSTNAIIQRVFSETVPSFVFRLPWCVCVLSSDRECFRHRHEAKLVVIGVCGCVCVPLPVTVCMHFSQIVSHFCVRWS